MPHGPDTRTPGSRQADERETLGSMLDYYRETVVWKCSGMSDEDLRKAIVPSGWSMLGMVNHLAYVEQWWFQELFAGKPAADLAPVPWTDEDPDADFRIGPDQSTESVLDFYTVCCERSRDITASASLDDLTAQWPADRPPERRPTLRWILVHLIEETARHAGHMDVVRELIDGATGD
jgi:uncharacterized damage-inducible protein DinB